MELGGQNHWNLQGIIEAIKENHICSTFLDLIILVLNLVKLTGVALHCLIALIFDSLSKCLMQEIGQNENRRDLNENHIYELCLL